MLFRIKGLEVTEDFGAMSFFDWNKQKNGERYISTNMGYMIYFDVFLALCLRFESLITKNPIQSFKNTHFNQSFKKCLPCYGL